MLSSACADKKAYITKKSDQSTYYLVSLFVILQRGNCNIDRKSNCSFPKMAFAATAAAATTTVLATCTHMEIVCTNADERTLQPLVQISNLFRHKFVTTSTTTVDGRIEYLRILPVYLVSFFKISGFFFGSVGRNMVIIPAISQSALIYFREFSIHLPT